MELVDEFPPVGESEIEDSQKFFVELLGVVLASTLTWALFRIATSGIIDDPGSISFNLSYMVLAPVVFLGPMMYYWTKHRGEEGLPVRILLDGSPQETFTQRFFLSMAAIGFSITLFHLLLELISQLIILNSGIYGDTEFNLSWMEKTNSFVAYIVLVITHLAVVATVEEIFFRGFVQDQLSRVLQTWQSVLISAGVFAMTHLPIAIFVLEIEGYQLITSLINWFGYGLMAGYLYHITRNIWVVVFWHGIWNVTVSTVSWSFMVMKFPNPEFETFVWILQAVSINAIVIASIFMMRDYLSRFGRLQGDVVES